MRTSGGKNNTLLVISYNYPPVGIMGGLRTSKFAKYLPTFGWHPTILTVSRDKTQWGSSDEAEMQADIKVIRAPFPDVFTFCKELVVRLGLTPSNRLRSPQESVKIIGTGPSRLGVINALRSPLLWIRQWVAFPDIYILWLPFALIRGLKELKTHDYDAIYSTSPPVTDHVIAAVLQRCTGIPWIADFRDPWTQNDFLAEEVSPLRLLLERRLEKRVLSHTAAIITVSEPWALMLSELHSDCPYGVSCISSGYDPDDYSTEIPIANKLFTITYTGSLYGLKRNPKVLLEAIDELIEDGLLEAGSVLVRFYGPYEEKLYQLRESLRNPGIVEINGIIPRNESIALQQESDAILILQGDQPYTLGLYGGKIFEHLGTRRPVIAITHSNGILAELVERTKIGFTSKEKRDIKEILLSWFEEFKATGRLQYNGKDEEVDKYKWYRLTKELADLLDRISKSRN